MALVMILFPLVMAAMAAALPSNRLRPWLLPLTAVLHALAAAVVFMRPELAAPTDWLRLDPAGKLVLLVVETLFLLCSFYAAGYLMFRQERSNRVFCACLAAFPGTVSAVVWSHHLGLMWVAIEATTLVSAPLIYFNHTQRSIEATWKYLIIGSVGIALALLGTFFLAYAWVQPGLDATLLLEDIVKSAPQMSKPWLHAAFVLLLVGYGMKMGLAPMHTWKPEVYGEVPGVVGAIFAGGITSCAFLAVLRVYQIAFAAGEQAYLSRLLLFFGLFSMAAAAVFMLGQRDIKRMLAYSSVEHMGILALGLGIGGTALFGTLLHVLTNGLTKGVLFLSSGNIHRAYGSKNIDQVRGAMRRLPLSGTLFLAGFLAIAGSPPFGPFVSLFTILNGAFQAGRPVAAGLFLLLLLLVFIGMGATVLAAVQGKRPRENSGISYRDTILTAGPIVAAMGIVLLLGLYMPHPLKSLLDSAATFLEGRP